MITTATVFILGAGSSAPYGFPLGSSLRAELCKPARSNSAQWYKQLIHGMGYPQDKVMAFSEAFLHSGNSSIDMFLSRNSKEFGDIGKAAIAATLIEKEIPARLYSPNSDVFPPQHSIEDDWYFELWNRILNGASSIEDLANNRVKFITFNYDRSLEQYLYTSCKHSFPDTDSKDALEALEHFPIFHVYGSLGKFGIATDGDTREYWPKSNPQNIRLAANAIKLIPEARDESDCVEIYDWLMEAERICFLGFGFDEMNVKRLRIAPILQERVAKNPTPPRIFVSTYGRTPIDVQYINSLVCPNIEWQPKPYTNLEMLLKTAVLR